MQGLGEFFANIKNRHAKEVILRTQIVEIIRKHAKIDVSLDGMTFKGTRIILPKLSHTEKSQILLKKLSILAELKEKIQNRVITDIS